LLMVPGIEVVGRLPAEIGTAAMFSAGRLTGSARADAAEAFLRFLRSDQAASELLAWGLEPSG
jgi:molybdate transport system substrate-binding protein